MDYHCLVCGESLTKVSGRLAHLKKHKLSVSDLQKYCLFGWYPSQLKIQTSTSGFLCPFCNSSPSSMVYHVRLISNKTTLNKLLVRCSKCLELFFVYRTKGMNLVKRQGAICPGCKHMSVLGKQGKEKYWCTWYIPMVEIPKEAFSLAESCTGYE